MGRALPIVVAIVLFVYALFDLIATPSQNTRYVPKLLWFVAILIPVVGPLLWIFLGVSNAGRPPGPGNIPRHPSTRGPDDDPDYLRGL